MRRTSSAEKLLVMMSDCDTESATASSELLLQTLWNAIKTANDVINECKYNQQNARSKLLSSNRSKSPTTSDHAPVTMENEELFRQGPSSGSFTDDHFDRWKMEPRSVTEEESLHCDFSLPPPVDFEGIIDDPMLLQCEDVVLPPPPPVFTGNEETKTISKETISNDAVSMETPCFLTCDDLKNFPNIQQKENNSKIVGGLFSVHQVRALFENNQMHVVREAVDMEETEDKRLEAEWKHSDLSSLSSGIITNKETDKVFDKSKILKRKSTVVITMTTLKEPKNRSDANGSFAESTLEAEQDFGMEFLELSSHVPNSSEKNVLRNGRNSLDTKKNLQIASEFDACNVNNATDRSINKNDLISSLITPDPDKKLHDPENKSHDLYDIPVDFSGSVLSTVNRRTLTAANGGDFIPPPAAAVEDILVGEGRAGGREEEEGPVAPAPAAAGPVDITSDGNLIPVILDAVDCRENAEAELNALSATNHTQKKLCSSGGAEWSNSDSNELLTSETENNGENAFRQKLSSSVERRKVELLHVNVSKNIEQKENERHFISRTVTKTMTQETRVTAAAMVTDFDAKPKTVSACASEDKTTTWEKSNFHRDLRVRNENAGETKNSENCAETKETDEEIEKAEGDLRKMKKMDRSIFDSLLDEKESGSERKCFSAFEQREATKIHVEKKSHNGTLAVHNFELKSISSLENSEKSKDSETFSKDHSTSNEMTERKEEIIQLPRPMSLTISPSKLPLCSASVKNSPASAVSLKLNVQNETSHGAPLATPEENLEDAPCASRGRRRSAGPSRSRQSSIGANRSHRSSVGSLLGFQLPPLSGISTHFVVVAIDFGTTYSGYAFSFIRDPDSIHMMRRWEGGDPGIINQKTPTTLLLTPDGKFHSFGFTARDFYHDLDVQEAKKWLYFEKFKMTLHHNADLNKETTLKAANGKSYLALTVFSHALTFFKDHALQELSDQSSTTIVNEDIRWVITVPAIWKAPAKQFMRHAAYQAGIASPDDPNQLLIALEPEAASVYVRKLRLYQLMPDPVINQLLKRESTPDTIRRQHFTDDGDNKDEYASSSSIKYKTLPSSLTFRNSICPTSTTASVGEEVDVEGTNYMVVDCGGGTVDITVYEMESGCGQLKELHKATGGPYGSLGIDFEFEKLLIGIFGSEFIEAFRTKRPAGWVDLMIAFESRKRTASPIKNNPLNVSLPFSFIDYYKKFKGSQVENAIRKYGNKEITWSSQGMLRLTTTAMRRLFQPTLDHIKQAVGDVLNNPNARDIKYMFLVGGFAESAILQMEMRKEFDHILKILIPQDVGLTILKGAVCFGLDPTVVSVRRCRMTYGVGVLNRFIPDKHPRSKMITKEGAHWCTDVFDKFVEVDQSVAIGETVVRSYTPAKAGQKSTIIHVYCTEKQNPEYITDPGVKRCGTLCLDLTDLQYRHSQKPQRREIQARMTFGDTEIKVTALDVATGKYVRAAIDFMNK